MIIELEEVSEYSGLEDLDEVWGWMSTVASHNARIDA